MAFLKRLNSPDHRQIRHSIGPAIRGGINGIIWGRLPTLLPMYWG